MARGEWVAGLRREGGGRLEGIPGGGKKTAERMVLELAEKSSKFAAEPEAATPAAVSADDVLSALVNLGYRKAEAERAVDVITRTGAPEEFGEFFNLPLKELTAGCDL